MNPQILTTLQTWQRGIRLYIAAAIGLVSVEVVWWSISLFGSTRLAAYRIEEFYAWFAVGLLAITLLVGPFLKIASQLPTSAKRMIGDSRRMLGIGAAWFASLHATTAYLSQFRTSNPFGLPTHDLQAICLGFVAVICLLALALTSFDRAMKTMGIWWFRLHRLVYLAALAGLMHAVMIGAHATNLTSLVALTALAVIWTVAQIYLAFRNADQQSTLKIAVMSSGVIVLFAVLNYGLTQHLGYNAILHGHEQHEGHQH